MPILDLQKRARELGRIRIGQVVEGTSKSGKKFTRPDKLDRFRLTSASQPLLERVAELYGGQVSEWAPANGGPQQWEVVTDATRLPVLVPPQPVSQWYELWVSGGCKRRCDGQTEILTDSPCICAAQDERTCKPTTRLNVVLRDVEGIGVWRLESHGFNAASELPQVAEFLAQSGGYVSAWLALEQRVIKRENAEGKVEKREFMVPTLEVDVTPAALLTGGAGIAGGALTSGPQPAGAIEAAVPQSRDWIADARAATTLDEWREVWRQARHAPEWTDQLGDQLIEIGRPLKVRESSGAGGAGEADEATASPGIPSAPVVDIDPELVWQQVLALAGEQGMSLADIEADFASRNGGVKPDTASASELHAYLQQLKEA